MKNDTLRTVLLFGGLTVLLAFDSGHLAGYAVLAALVHETGHLIAYRRLRGRWPKLKASMLGFSLFAQDGKLSTTEENCLLAAGPAANFVIAIITYLFLQYRASYSGYFFACENLLMGLFNLLPIGFLDGGRLLQNCFATPDFKLLRILSASMGIGICVTLGTCFFAFGQQQVNALLTAAALLLLFWRAISG